MLALGAGAGAGLYAAFAPATTTVVEQAAASGVAVRTAASAQQLSINAIYLRDYQGVVELTVSSNAAGGGPFGFGSQASQAEGSGFVYDGSGDIVTNDHVVSGASSLRVKFWNGQIYPAHVVGTDPSTDLAVVKVSAPSGLLHPLALGDSGGVSVGDPVVAIGSPFGLDETVTSGIVSALHRSITSPNNFAIAGAIQTDAAINHGNSGGPLIDAAGDVIGVNSQIQSDSGGNEGVGFAIPSNTVARIANLIIAGTPVKHAFVGVFLNGSSAGGAQITTVQAGSPASKAGLQQGDLVTAIDGKAITSTQQFIETVDTFSPGQTVTLTVKHGGSTNSVKVTLGTRPATQPNSGG